jgi:hypothetical protein
MLVLFEAGEEIHRSHEEQLTAHAVVQPLLAPPGGRDRDHLRHFAAEQDPGQGHHHAGQQLAWDDGAVGHQLPACRPWIRSDDWTVSLSHPMDKATVNSRRRSLVR